MTRMSRLLSLFPLIHAMVVLGLFLGAGLANSRGICLSLLSGGFVVLYLLPPFLFRLHNFYYPLQQGRNELSDPKRYISWWGGHQLQGLFLAFSSLEAVLRIVPGLYSAWLRLWGAKIGKGVYWTPQIEIIDRSLVDIGDGVIFGYQTKLCSHVVIRRRGALDLYVRSLTIGPHCFVGAHSHLGPGTRVEAGVTLPYSTLATVNRRFGKPGGNV